MRWPRRRQSVLDRWWRRRGSPLERSRIFLPEPVLCDLPVPPTHLRRLRVTPPLRPAIPLPRPVPGSPLRLRSMARRSPCFPLAGFHSTPPAQPGWTSSAVRALRFSSQPVLPTTATSCPSNRGPVRRNSDGLLPWFRVPWLPKNFQPPPPHLLLPPQRGPPAQPSVPSLSL